METIGSFMLLSVCGSAFLWHFEAQDKLSFFDKFLQLMFLKVCDVVCACYNEFMFIKNDDDDDNDNDNNEETHLFHD